MMVRSKKPDRALWVFETDEDENPERILQPAGWLSAEERPATGYRRNHGPDWQRFGIHPGKNNLTILHGFPGVTVELRQPVAFAHLDGDGYPGITAGLQQVTPALAAGGTLLVNDYYLFGGCREAVDDFFRGDRRCGFVFSNRGGKLLVRKKP
jgi:asparagine synthase (glutamine-hydrolysing)